MIRNYFWVIHIAIEKIIIEITQPAHDAPWRSPESPNVRNLQGSFRGLLRDQYKNWYFMKKIFSEVIVLVLRIGFCFLLEEHIFQSSKRGHPRDVRRTHLRDVHGTKW